MSQLLILPHIQVHNANALSSPFTIGFPAMTGFLGAVHALQRKINQIGIKANFTGVGVISHHANLQTYKGDGDFVHSIIGTANPLDKTGARSAFIEEARIDLDVSLVVEVEGASLEQRQTLLTQIDTLLNGHMKLAGGDILAAKTPYFHVLNTYDDYTWLQKQLMPGYAIVERRDLMQSTMESGVDALDALIDHLAIHNTCDVDEHDPERVRWHQSRKQAGWIVPIATGFHRISELAQAKNQRDEHTPHGFAESVVTLGEFKMPHRIKHLDQLLWRYHVSSDSHLYLCQQDESDPQQVDTVETIDDEF